MNTTPNKNQERFTAEELLLLIEMALPLVDQSIRTMESISPENAKEDEADYQIMKQASDLLSELTSLVGKAVSLTQDGNELFKQAMARVDREFIYDKLKTDIH